MNVQLLAAGVFLVHSGALLVSDKYELAYALQTQDDLELVRRLVLSTVQC